MVECDLDDEVVEVVGAWFIKPLTLPPELSVLQ